MVNYNCIRCGYTTKDKSKMKSHFSRKTVCKPILNDICLDEYKKDILNGKIINLKKSSVNLGKSSVNPGKSSVNFGKNQNIEIQDSSSDISDEELEVLNDNKKELICKYCKKSFRRKDYLESHLKKSCKMLKEFNNIYIFDKNTFGKKIYKGFKNSGDIYIIQTDYINDDHYKIGLTNNIQKRLSQYRCENTYEPRLHYYISCQNIKLIEKFLKINLSKNNIKNDIYQGDIEYLKNSIIRIIKKNFGVNKVYVYEPEIKIGNLSKCLSCNKCFYTKKDVFEHFNLCEEYKESLAKGKDYKCKYCYKNLSSYKNLWRHYKSCKEKEKDEICKKDMMELVELLNKRLDQYQKQLEKKDKQIEELINRTGINNSTINQTIHQNIQQNIKLLAYNDTDVSHLTDKDYLKIFNHSNMCIPHLIKQIHFNPNKPENNNIYISNLKNNYVMIYDGNKWVLRNQNEEIENLLDKNETILEQKLEEWKINGKMYPEIYKKFERYLDIKENDDVLNKIKEEVKLILYNNRKLK